MNYFQKPSIYRRVQQKNMIKILTILETNLKQMSY